MRHLIFDANGIVLEPYDAAALNPGKTPDSNFSRTASWSAIANSNLSGTLKSSNLRPTATWRSRKNLPFYRKLGQHVRGASQQFDAENLTHDKPNVMVFVSHTPEIERRDLIVTIAGLAMSDGRRMFMLGKSCSAGYARRNERSICFCGSIRPPAPANI
jgi:hypothetical protein